jgi:hypothetical protein
MYITQLNLEQTRCGAAAAGESRAQRLVHAPWDEGRRAKGEGEVDNQSSMDEGRCPQDSWKFHSLTQSEYVPVAGRP